MSEQSPENRTHAVVFAEQQERLHRLEEAVQAVSGMLKGRSAARVRFDCLDWKAPVFRLSTDYGDNGAQFDLRGPDVDKLIEQAFDAVKGAMTRCIADIGKNARLFAEATGTTSTSARAAIMSEFAIALLDEKGGHP